MSYMKRFLEEVMSDIGADLITDEVLEEANKRLNQLRQSQYDEYDDLITNFHNVELSVYHTAVAEYNRIMNESSDSFETLKIESRAYDCGGRLLCDSSALHYASDSRTDLGKFWTIFEKHRSGADKI